MLPGKLAWLGLSLAASLAAGSASAQVSPTGERQEAPFTVGAGGSAFTPDFNDGVMLGVTFWADYRPGFIARHAGGLSIAGELRDLNYRRSASQTNLREDTYTAGVQYEWQRFWSVRPYGRAMGGIGTIDFPSTSTYNHDSRGIGSFSGGADFRLYQNVWLRADYEYQYWPGLFSRNLHPQGVTVGVLYDFRARRPDF